MGQHLSVSVQLCQTIVFDSLLLSVLTLSSSEICSACFFVFDLTIVLVVNDRPAPISEVV